MSNGLKDFLRIKFYDNQSFLGSYTMPLDDKLGTMMEEIREAIACKDYKGEWRVTIVKMTQEEYDNLPEFVGY